MRRQTLGFTLVELLIALALLAVMAGMAWLGLDGMVRTQASAALQNDRIQVMQRAMSQWQTDLDQLRETGVVSALDFNGRVLRLTRRIATAQGEQVQVVAWGVAAGTGDGGEGGTESRNTDAPESGQWRRWVSAECNSQEQVRQAWDAALREWPQRSLVLFPASQVQIAFHRNGAWTNPQSSADAQNQNGPAAVQPLPDGVRLSLTLDSAAQSLLVDWVRPSLGATR